jgi:hypothetical protein
MTSLAHEILDQVEDDEFGVEDDELGVGDDD